MVGEAISHNFICIVLYIGSLYIYKYITPIIIYVVILSTIFDANIDLQVVIGSSDSAVSFRRGAFEAVDGAVGRVCRGSSSLDGKRSGKSRNPWGRSPEHDYYSHIISHIIMEIRGLLFAIYSC